MRNFEAKESVTLVTDATTTAVAAEKHLETQEEAKKQKRTFAAAA
jgi:hypothetical protein